MNDLVDKFLADLFSKSELNILPESYGGGKIFSKPLIGVSRGDDQIFEEYKELISQNHLTPLEVWRASGLSDENASQLRIISIICPFTKEIREESMKAKKMPAEIYSIGRNYANAFKLDVIKQTIKFFQGKGFQATAGMISEAFNIYRNFTSSWSERHIAFAAGLGSFSLHEGFISKVGCNIRICSVITNAPLKVTPRESDEPYRNCLFYVKGSCMECVKKCPADAISEKGHDKMKCWSYGRKVEAEMNNRLGSILKPHWRRVEGEMREQKPPVGCAFCQYGVPCMDKNPMEPEI